MADPLIAHTAKVDLDTTPFIFVLLVISVSLSLFGYQLTEETSLHPLLILATYANSLEAIAILFFAMKIRRKEPPS